MQFALQFHRLARRLVSFKVANVSPPKEIVLTIMSFGYGRAESGIFSNTPGNDVKISIMNPDHCSVFRLELIAISGALDHALNSDKDSI
ncbi:hypothetical protein TNCV_3630721 [Trichonephila clavipes]|nr:hypothetical protein TNCV_3630721 [Trichonephila clavipes]